MFDFFICMYSRLLYLLIYFKYCNITIIIIIIIIIFFFFAGSSSMRLYWCSAISAKLLFVKYCTTSSTIECNSLLCGNFNQFCIFYVLFQKPVRGFHQGFQTRENWRKHEAACWLLLLFLSVKYANEEAKLVESAVLKSTHYENKWAYGIFQ